MIFRIIPTKDKEKKIKTVGQNLEDFNIKREFSFLVDTEAKLVYNCDHNDNQSYLFTTFLHDNKK